MVTKYGKIGYPVDKIITESIIIDNDRNSKNKMIKIIVELKIMMLKIMITEN